MARPVTPPTLARNVTHGAKQGSRLERRTVGPWIYVGTDGVDGVDAGLAANPHPFATGDTPGPPPFQNGISNLDASSGGLRYRWGPHGIQLDCGGGLSGVAPNTVITTLVGVEAPDTVKHGVDVDVDGGVFTWELDTSLNLTYLAAV